MPKVKSGRDKVDVVADITAAQATLNTLSNNVVRYTYYSPGSLSKDQIASIAATAQAHAAQHAVVGALQDELAGTGQWKDKALAPWGGYF